MKTLTSMDLDDALQHVLTRTRQVPGCHPVTLTDAIGRVLAEPVSAPMNLPPFAASAMDGYALRSGDAGVPNARLSMVGASLAGHPYLTGVPDGGCVRIFTGAALPAQADAVALQENCRLEGDTVIVEHAIRAGENVRPVGHDIRAGAPMLDAGRRLSALDAGWLAASGVTGVVVRERPCIGILSTGDELREPGTQLPPGAIYDANRTILAGLLRALPVQVIDFGIVADQRATIADILEDAGRNCDAVITSGGVSVGDADWVRDVVQQLGTLELWRLNLKPGKPLAYGQLPRAAFFGLPGNPVSAIVTFLLVVRPAIEVMCGCPPSQPPVVPATLTTPVAHQPGREEYQRAFCTFGGDEATVAVTQDQGSNRLASFAAANCLVRIPKDAGNLPAGSRVATLPFRGLL